MREIQYLTSCLKAYHPKHNSINAKTINEGDEIVLKKDRIRIQRVTREMDRRAALSVLKAIYCTEKNWVQDENTIFPPEDLNNDNVSWFLVHYENDPAGVLRILYDPPLDLYAEYGFETLRDELDLDAFIRNHKIAEIGRFAILPKYRTKIRVASALMRAASEDTIRRGYSHYITDVFEGEVHSPYQFHTQVIGFQPVATHTIGEMNCKYRRITMILNLLETLHRLRQNNKRFYHFLTKDWDKQVLKLITAKPLHG